MCYMAAFVLYLWEDIFMSENNWESQPRLKNGEFTFRNKSRMMQSIFQKVKKKLEAEEIKKTTRGGSYGFLRKFTAGNKKYEIHHMPAASCSPLTRWKGPCIIMSKQDHKDTSSYGKLDKAVRFRKWQAKLISEGRFMDAELMDITSIRRRFGDRYDKSIMEKLDYEKELKKAGVING